MKLRRLLALLQSRARRPRSLRFELLSRVLLVLAALLLVIGSLQFLFLQRLLYQNKAEAIRNQIRSLPAELWNRAMPLPRRGFQGSFIFIPNASLAFVDNEGKKTILSALNSADGTVPELEDAQIGEAVQRPREAKPYYFVVDDREDGEQLVVLQAIRAFGQPLGVVQVSTSTKPLKDELYRQSLLYSGLSLAALFIGLLALQPAIRRTLTPLMRIVGTVERINSGNLDERLPTGDRPLEADRLSRSVNGMLGRLEDAFRAEQEAKEQMRRFVADASHELRTPLTSIHGFLQVLLRGAASEPEQLKKALGSMLGESERINKLVEDLLLLAKLDRTPALDKTPCDLSGIVGEMEPQLTLLAGRRKIELHLEANCRIVADRDKLKQVVLNLFHNAVQHTDPEAGRITVAVARTDEAIGLTVGDNGPGIAAGHLPHLFDRFYRIESSRARRHGGGAGLGLSITRSLVELHGGAIAVDSSAGAGSRFRVTLPPADTNIVADDVKI